MSIVLYSSGISKRYGKVQAANKVDLSLNSGNCIALLGRNGAGKTTICELLVGVVVPDSGVIKLFGDEFHAHIPNRRKVLENVGVLSQETQLYKKLTIKETLSLFASFYQSALSVDLVIKQLGLEDKKNKRLEHISGGERQRAYLGATLVGNPKLIFLDEPTSGLDPMSRKNVWEIIEELKKEGKSIFLTTHYMEEAARLADEVAIIEKGTIIAKGTPCELIKQHCEEDVISIQLEEIISATDLSALQAIYHKLTVIKDNILELETSKILTAIKQLISFFDKTKNGIVAMEFRRGTLEDVFFKLTGKKLP